MEIEYQDLKFRVFNKMVDFVNGNRMMYMTTKSARDIDIPFIKSVVPALDVTFNITEDDTLKIDGKVYVRVDMCEEDFDDVSPAYMLKEALNQEVFQIYTRVGICTHESDNRCFETLDDAKWFMRHYYK